MSEFFAMGGYAAFVWPAYGTAAVILLGLLLSTLRSLRAGETTLRALEDSRPKPRRARAASRTGGQAGAREMGTREVREG
jgi:heme exporter protein D